MVHSGPKGLRLAKVFNVSPNSGEVMIVYVDTGMESGFLKLADIAAASPAQVAEGEALPREHPASMY